MEVERAPKIVLRHCKGFVRLEADEKIRTEPFLNASREIVAIIESFGKLFSPVVYDMNGNIQKLDKHYQQDTINHNYLEDMMLRDLSNPKNKTKSSLLWLKRALEMIETFFTNVFADYRGTCSDNLKEALSNAYQTTLQPYHGWLVQQTFSMIQRWTPRRSELFGVRETHDENMRLLDEAILPPLRAHLRQINEFFTTYNLHDNSKV